jgi:hypothetical protein
VQIANFSSGSDTGLIAILIKSSNQKIVFKTSKVPKPQLFDYDYDNFYRKFFNVNVLLILKTQKLYFKYLNGLNTSKNLILKKLNFEIS